MKKLRVGVVGPIWLNLPPNGYGGTEDVVMNLVSGLTDLGHDVSLFGPKTARVNAKLIPTVDIPLREQDIPWTDFNYTAYHITKAFDMADQFDVLHVHLNQDQDSLALPLALQSKTPVVFTFHYPLPSFQWKPEKARFLQKYKHLPYTSISQSQQRLPLNFIATVYNSLRIDEYPFSDETEDYYVWLGKIKPEKGTKEAMLAAIKAKVKLYVMGTVDKGDPSYLEYYNTEIKPLFDYKYLHWMGVVDIERKVKFLQHAKGFLNPIQWEEPFGLVMIEAQATGTPVLSYRRGAAPELIVEGKTGFLVDTFEEFLKRMSDLEKLDRHACRKNVEDHYTVPTMVDGYLRAYEKTISIWDECIAKQKEALAS